MSDTTDPAAEVRELCTTWLGWFDADEDDDPPWFPERRSEIADHLRAVAAVVAELEQLRRQLAAVEGAWRCWHCGTQHGPVLCTACVDRVTEKARTELEQLRAELARHQPGPEPFFEPGHAYLSENRAFRFACERVVDGVALGVEERLDGRPQFASNRVWKSVMPEGCWTDVTDAQPTAEDGRG